MASYTYPIHGGQLRQIAERFGMAASELLDFSANINPEGPPTGALAAMREALEDAATFTDYPDLQETELKRSISRYAAVPVENIAVANGFVPLLEAALRALQIRRCVLPVPAFVEYRRTLERLGVAIETHALHSESCFRYDPAEMFDERCDAILLANPQNPSGVCHSAEQIRELVVEASRRNMYVLLDEAFIDYLPEESLTTRTDEFPHLVVFRSVTKFHGMPGLRVAYAVACPAVTLAINDGLAPWPITTLAARGVGEALDDQEYALRSRSSNDACREVLRQELEALGLTVYASAANFLLFQLPSGLRIDPENFWQHMIVLHRIVLRDCGNYEGLAPGHFRAAVRRGAENKKLLAAIEASLTRLKTAD